MNINNNVVAHRSDSGSASSAADASTQLNARDVSAKSASGKPGVAHKNFSQTLQDQKHRAAADATVDPQNKTVQSPAAAKAAANDADVKPTDKDIKDSKQKSDADRDATGVIDINGLLAMLPAAQVPATAAAAASSAAAAGASGTQASQYAGLPLTAVNAVAGHNVPPTAGNLDTGTLVAGQSAQTAVNPAAGQDESATGNLKAAAANTGGLLAMAQKMVTAATKDESGHDLSALVGKLATTADVPAATNPAASMLSLNNVLPPMPTVIPTAVHTAMLAMDPGHADWAGAVGHQVLLTASAGLQKADLHLHPAELGMLHVQIRIEGGQTGIIFTAEHPAARAALEQSMPQLREMFSQQGLSLAQTQVFSQTPRDSQGARPQSFRSTSAQHSDALEPVAAAPVQVTRRGLLDDYA